MTKEKRIKSFIIGLFIFLIGITNVNAASYTGFDFTAQLYDNLGPSLTAVTTSGPTAGTGAYEGYIAYTANSSGGAWGISSPVTLIANHTYTLTASIPNECGNVILSTYNRIGVGTTLSNAKTSYQNNTNVTEVYSKAIAGNNYLIQYAFTPTINGSFIVFPFATSVSCSSSRTFLESVSIEDLGVDGVTQDEINTSLTNQTNEINTSIENSTNTITGAITDTETNINSNIDNMEESINGTIKDNFNDCHESYNLIDFSNISGYNNATYSFDNDNLTVTAVTTGTYNHIHYNLTSIVKNNPGKDIRLDIDSLDTSNYNSTNSIIAQLIITYNDNTQYIVLLNKNGISYTQTLPTDFANLNNVKLAIYANNSNSLVESEIVLKKPMLHFGSSKINYEPYGEEICSNKIDETNDKLDETNNQLGDLNDSLNDSNVDGSLDSAGSFFDNFSTTDHGGLSGIITAPLVAINEMLNTSCSPMTATFKGKELSLPCGYEFWNRLGAIQDFVNIVLGGMLCYRIIIKLYKLIERIKNPEDDRLEVMDL